MPKKNTNNDHHPIATDNNNKKRLSNTSTKQKQKITAATVGSPSPRRPLPPPGVLPNGVVATRLFAASAPHLKSKSNSDASSFSASPSSAGLTSCSSSAAASVAHQHSVTTLQHSRSPPLASVNVPSSRSVVATSLSPASHHVNSPAPVVPSTRRFPSHFLDRGDDSPVHTDVSFRSPSGSLPPLESVAYPVTPNAATAHKPSLSPEGCIDVFTQSSATRDAPPYTPTGVFRLHRNFITSESLLTVPLEALPLVGDYNKQHQGEEEESTVADAISPEELQADFTAVLKERFQCNLRTPLSLPLGSCYSFMADVAEMSKDTVATEVQLKPSEAALSWARTVCFVAAEQHAPSSHFFGRRARQALFINGCYVHRQDNSTLRLGLIVSNKHCDFNSGRTALSVVEEWYEALSDIHDAPSSTSSPSAPCRGDGEERRCPSRVDPLPENITQVLPSCDVSATFIEVPICATLRRGVEMKVWWESTTSRITPLMSIPRIKVFMRVSHEFLGHCHYHRSNQHRPSSSSRSPSPFVPSPIDGVDGVDVDGHAQEEEVAPPPYATVEMRLFRPQDISILGKKRRQINPLDFVDTSGNPPADLEELSQRIVHGDDLHQRHHDGALSKKRSGIRLPMTTMHPQQTPSSCGANSTNSPSPVGTMPYEHILSFTGLKMPFAGEYMMVAEAGVANPDYVPFMEPLIAPIQPFRVVEE